MASMKVHDSKIVITCGVEAVVLQIDDKCNNCPTVVKAPKLEICVAEETDGCDKSDATLNNCGTQATIILACFSQCNKWMVLCSTNKQLSLWSTGDWSLVSNRTLIRAASSVKFTPSGRYIVIADKSGDAYQYSVENPVEQGSLLLGHLSMLLDILVTPDEKYVITCDRDEKIRVSKFPNAYNIKCYCLGHKEFVTQISLLPHDTSILVSSSGDGSIIFWDYMCGRCINTENCSKRWQLNNPAEKADLLSEEELPIKSFTCAKAAENVTTLGALLTGVNGCLIYNVCYKLGNVHCDLIQVLNLSSEPWDMAIMFNKYLWILSPAEKETIQVFVQKPLTSQFILDSTLLEDSIKSGVSSINGRSNMFASISPPKPINILYKRTFNNIQEYHERKKKRLEKSSVLTVNA